MQCSSLADFGLRPILLLSHLEKARLSGSSPGSTQRCRAAEKCPQATAISANTQSTLTPEEWQIAFEL